MFERYRYKGLVKTTFVSARQCKDKIEKLKIIHDYLNIMPKSLIIQGSFPIVFVLCNFS